MLGIIINRYFVLLKVEVLNLKRILVKISNSNIPEGFFSVNAIVSIRFFFD